MTTEAVWSAILSAGLGLIGWVLKSNLDEVKRLNILLNRTREEIARDYVTKNTLHTDMQRVLDQLKRLDEKLDRLMGPLK
jgi:hypothetical protein